MCTVSKLRARHSVKHVTCIFSLNSPHLPRRQVLSMNITLQMRKLRSSQLIRRRSELKSHFLPQVLMGPVQPDSSNIYGSLLVKDIYWSLSCQRSQSGLQLHSCPLETHGPTENSVSRSVTWAMMEIHTGDRQYQGGRGWFADGSQFGSPPLTFKTQLWCLLPPHPAVCSSWKWITRMLMLTVLPASRLSSRWQAGGQNLSTSGL